MRHAFTLIELLIVMAIIMVLAALLTPIVLNAMQEADRTAVANDVSRLSVIWEALKLEKGVYPTPEMDNLLTYDPMDVVPGILNSIVDPYDFSISLDRLDENKHYIDLWDEPIHYVLGNYANRISKATWDEAVNIPQDTNKPIGDPATDIAAESDWNPENKGAFPYIWSYGGAMEDESEWIYQKK